jgi:hypothetical protein
MFQALADDFAQKLQPIADQCVGKTPQANGFADTLLSIVEGSIILAKAHRDPTRIPKAIRGFRLSLATLVAIPGVGPPGAMGQVHSEAVEIFKGTRTQVPSVESGKLK